VRIEVLLIIDVKRIRPQPLEVFHRALVRRGWHSTAKGTYRIALETDADDKQIVNYVGRDVREAEYVAGLKNLQSVIVLNSGNSPPFDSYDQMQEEGSDVSLI
jgi:hypothetical protein